MSDIKGRGNEDFAKYDTMSTEELQEILRQDASSLEGADSDIDLLLYVMEVLADRRRNSSNPGITALEAYASFQKNYLYDEDTNEDSPDEDTEDPKVVRFGGLRRLTAIAAVLVIIFLGSVTANAFGFWDIIAQWTKETFHFAIDGQTGISEPTPSDNLVYNSLDEALASLNIPTDIVPSHIPNDYILTYIIAEETPLQKTVIAKYENGANQIRIHIQSYIENDPEQIEQGGYAETYPVDDKVFYIFTNEEQLRAVWETATYECYISGDLTIDEIKSMIDSIGKG